MNELKDKLLWLMLWLVLTFSSIYSFTVNHEEAHKEVCIAFDGNATIEIFYKNMIGLGDSDILGLTHCNITFKSQDELNAFNIANSNIEATYPLQTVILSMFLITLLWKL